MVVLISTDNIPKEEAKKYLILSVVVIIVTPFLSLFGLYNPSAYGTGIFMFITSLTFFVFGIVSFIFYFVNHEIMYGMCASRKKCKEIDNRNVRIGRRVLLVIIISGLCVNLFFYFTIITQLSWNNRQACIFWFKIF